ncbi:hypothetical protein H4R27_002691 [Coemansia aciculifera]|nr:hypothetical protein H4R27_002691 [Coemansia aciculifera]
MPRIQLSSLDEFITSLSRLDYEAAKLASGRVMEASVTTDHIQMGALMFSLLTIEMMYTSMDYLTPSNFRRGNNYYLNMYDPLPRRLSKLLKKVNADYEEEHERLVSLGARPAYMEPSAFGNPAAIAHGDNPFFPSHAQYKDNAGIPTHTIAAPSDPRGLITDPNQLQAPSRSRDGASAFRPVDRSRTAQKGAEYRRWPDNEHELRSGAGAAEPFDPNQYIANMDEAEKVLQELETVTQLVDFISKLIEVRKTMLVLYRFVAVTGPVLYVHKLGIMLSRCKEMLQTITPNSLYQSLLDHVRNEVLLVSSLVDWNSHISLHNVVQSMTSMKHAKTLLRVWKDALPSGEAPAMAKQARSPDNLSASHSLLYSAFAKSSRIVHNLLWGDGGRNSTSGSQGPTLGRMRGIIVWIGWWTDFLTFKTTAYFQQIIAPHRSLFHEETPSSARQSAVLDDIWSRPGLSKANLYDMITTFMHNYDGCFVSLLFESSKQRPYVLDGFAIAGSKVKVPDYRVQACAVLFCLSNQKLLQARGHALCGSLTNEVHSSKASSANSTTHLGSQQCDVEWFRQNCLPDILCVLDSDRATLDLELLGSSPLLGRLGTEADGLLAELGGSVDEVIEKALMQLSETERADANANNVISDEWLSGEVKHDDRRPDSMLGPEDDDNSDPDDHYITEADAAAALHINIPGPDSQHHLKALAHDDNHALHHDDYDAAPDHMMTMHSNDYTMVDQTNVDVMHAQDEGSNLYSTYLLKSHLRNNLPHDWQARKAHASRHFVGRQSGRAPIQPNERYDAGGTPDEHAHMAAPTGRISTGNQNDTTSDARDSAAAHPVLARRKTDDFRAMSGRGLDARPTGGRPVTMHVASGGGGVQVKGSQPAVRPDSAVPLAADNLAEQRRQSTEPGLVSDRRGQGARGSISSTNVQVARHALSIRSFFQSTSRLGVPVRQVEQRVEDSELARRVRCGERLKGLFGPWHTHGDDEQTHGELSASLGGNSRRGSVHSLAFSTHIRTNLGAKTAAAATAAIPNTEARGGGFTHRLSRAAAPLVTSAAATAPVASRGSEHQFGPSQQQRALAARGQHSRLVQQSDVNVGHMAAAAAPTAAQPLPAAAATMAGSGLEGCTYLYSRAGMPNIMMVAVLLDTERGLGRRREAERAWDEIVDAVRGTSMYERLMALPS